MIEFIQAIPFSYAALFPVLNPLGSAVIFLSLTMGMSEQALQHLAGKVAINTFILLVAVLLTGSWILGFFGISIPVVQIAGGLVMASIGWRLLNQTSTNKNNETTVDNTGHDLNAMAFFPLTMPLTAGPGSIAVTLTVGAHEIRKTVFATVCGQLGAIVGILLAAATVFLCYRYAYRLTQMLGASGTQVIMRLSAFVNVCIGIQIIWHGVHGLITFYM